MPGATPAQPVFKLANLRDVALSSPTNTQVLTYNSGTSKWVNANAAGGLSISGTQGRLVTIGAGGNTLADSGISAAAVTYVASGSLSIDARIIYPHLLCSGAGTEASPWTHADGTAGIQTAVNALAAGRGGRVELAAGRYAITNVNGVLITTHSIAIVGAAPGFPIDNAEVEGLHGTKLKCAGKGIRFGAPYATRPTGILIENIYFDGPNRASGSIGVQSIDWSDKCEVHRCHFRGFDKAIAHQTTGSWDAGVISNCEITECNNGIYATGASCMVYGHIRGNTIADLHEWGIYLNGAGNMIVTDNHILRTQEDAIDDAAARAQVYLEGGGFTFVGNALDGSGVDANLMLVGDNNTVVGNAVSGGGVNAIRLEGDRNFIGFNTMAANDRVHIEGGDDNVIEDRKRDGFNTYPTIGGTRTIFNGVSYNAGDPLTANPSDWYGISKPQGLGIYDTVNNVLKWFWTYSGTERAFQLISDGVQTFSGSKTFSGGVSVTTGGSLYCNRSTLLEGNFQAYGGLCESFPPILAWQGVNPTTIDRGTVTGDTYPDFSNGSLVTINVNAAAINLTGPGFRSGGNYNGREGIIYLLAAQNTQVTLATGSGNTYAGAVEVIGGTPQNVVPNPIVLTTGQEARVKVEYRSRTDRWNVLSVQIR